MTEFWLNFVAAMLTHDVSAVGGIGAMTSDTDVVIEERYEFPCYSIQSNWTDKETCFIIIVNGKPERFGP